MWFGACSANASGPRAESPIPGLVLFSWPFWAVVAGCVAAVVGAGWWLTCRYRTLFDVWWAGRPLLVPLVGIALVATLAEWWLAVPAALIAGVLAVEGASSSGSLQISRALRWRLRYGSRVPACSVRIPSLGPLAGHRHSASPNVAVVAIHSDRIATSWVPPADYPFVLPAAAGPMAVQQTQAAAGGRTTVPPSLARSQPQDVDPTGLLADNARGGRVTGQHCCLADVHRALAGEGGDAEACLDVPEPSGGVLGG